MRTLRAGRTNLPDQISTLIAEGAGRAMGVTFVLNNLADTARAAGDHVAARRWYGECLALARQIGQMDRICLSADGLGALAWPRAVLRWPYICCRRPPRSASGQGIALGGSVNPPPPG